MILHTSINIDLAQVPAYIMPIISDRTHIQWTIKWCMYLSSNLRLIIRNEN